MRPKQIRRREPEGQDAGAADFKAVVVNCEADTTADAVIAVANRVGNCFAKRIRWIERLVNSFKDAGNNSSGDGEVIAEKTLSALVEIEGVADLLAIIEELRFINAAKAGQTKQAVRKSGSSD